MDPKLKVFISSAQFENEFQTERESLPVIFDKEPLRSLFSIWEIESISSPLSVNEQYSKNVLNSDILILLLAKSIRSAVKKEFNLAKQHGRNIFCFIRTEKSPDKDLVEFINNDVRQKVTTTDYVTFKELCLKIENSLLQHYFQRQQLPIEDSNIVQPPKTISTDEKALRILVGILDSEVATSLREQVLTSLLLESLSLSSSPVEILECYNRIAQILKIDVNLIQPDLNRLLLSLSSSGRIISVNDTSYTLSPSQKAQISVIDGSIDTQETSSLRQYYQKHKTFLPSVSYDYYAKIIRESLSNVVFTTAYSNASIQIKGDTNPISYDAEELNRLLLSILYQINPTIGDLPNWQAALADVLSSKDKQTIFWINRSYKAYWSLAALGLDPDCTKYKYEHLKNYCVYLDSHIVIRALVEAGSDSRLCSDIISLGHQADINMRISEAMFQEVEKSFEVANKAFYAAEQDISRALNFYRKLHRKSDILEGYMQEKSHNKYLTWEQFLNRFYSPSNYSKLRSFIQNELGISLVDDTEFTIQEWGEINELVELLMKKRGKSFVLKNKMPATNQDEYDRQVILRTNEARQMGIIYHLRQKNTDDTQYWFVTFDEFIYRTSIDLANSGNQFYRFPCYMKPARWLEILVHSSQQPLDVNTFREILMSPTFQHVADSVESEVISEMLDARVDQTIKDISTLRNMFADIVSRPAVQDAYTEVLSASAGAQALRASEKVKDKIIEAMSEEMQKLKTVIDEKDEAIQKEKKDKEKQINKARYFKQQYRKVQTAKKSKPKKRF